MEKLKVGILFGGFSSEYEVSLKSATSVLQNIDKTKYDVIMIGITKNGEFYLYNGPIQKIESNEWMKDSIHKMTFSLDKSHKIINLDNHEEIKIDIAFPVLHGRNGEDGRLQGFFELIHLPYVGCDMTSSALAMDKFLAHSLVSYNGIKVPKSYLYHKYSSYDIVKKEIENLSYPIFVKPLKAGSSLGISKVDHMEQLESAMKEAFLYDDKIVIEEGIDGFEVGCAVLGNETLIIGEVDEIELQNGFFDYEEKYNTKTSKTILPARLDESTREKIKETALSIYKILGCTGLARIDMFYTKTGEIVFNEVNTIPGFTSHSRYPSMLKVIGYNFPDIIDKAIELGLEKWK